MELLERTDALGTLGDLLTASADGGRVAIVSGEAGAGKSALVGAFAAGAGPHVRMLWGACDPLLTPRALGPLHDIARQVGGVLAQRLGPDERRDAAFDALLDELDGPRQRPRPVVVLEDLHWADEATLDLVAFLGRRLVRCRALLVITYRDDDVGPAHPLRAVLAGLPRAHARRLTLPPLSVAAVAELARRAGRPDSQVYEVTGGNPLLVTEVLAAAGPGVPATVRDLVLSRLTALSPPAREVAGLVSVVPLRAESALLTSRATEAVEECLARGVLVPDGNGVAFRHELLRRAVEESLSPVRRAALHAGVLATLVRRAGVDPARLVHHAHHADDTAAVLRWAPVAARSAAAVGAYRQAVAHYAVAVPRAAGLPAPQRAGLLEAYSFAAYLAGASEGALTARREALALRETGPHPDAVKVGEDLRWVSRLCWWTGRNAEARTVAVRAVEVLESVPPGRALAMAYSNLSQLHMLADEAVEAITWGDRALVLARRFADVETETHALVNVGSARMRGGYTDGRAELEQAYAVAAGAGFDDHAARALANLATFALEHGEHLAAADALDRALRFTTDRDLDGYRRHLLGHRAALRLARGEWAAARADAEAALSGVDRPGPSLLQSTVVLGRLRSRCGEPGAAELLTDAAEQAYATGELQFVGPAATAVAEHFWLDGDAARAVAEARRGLTLAVRVGQPWYAGELAHLLWLAGAPPEVPVSGLATPYRLLIGGDWAGAAAEWAARGCSYARAEALACGDAAAADEALRIMDGLGAVRTARRLRAVLRGRGVTGVTRGPRRSTAVNPSGLTARQMEVVALLAGGLSNAEIAARLSLSAKTVDHHVSAVLAKLCVPTRGQAAAAARRLGIG